MVPLLYILYSVFGCCIQDFMSRVRHYGNENQKLHSTKITFVSSLISNSILFFFSFIINLIFQFFLMIFRFFALLPVGWYNNNQNLRYTRTTRIFQIKTNRWTERFTQIIIIILWILFNRMVVCMCVLTLTLEQSTRPSFGAFRVHCNQFIFNLSRNLNENLTYPLYAKERPEKINK